MMRGEITIGVTDVDLESDDTSPRARRPHAEDVETAGRVMTAAGLLAFVTGLVVPFQATIALLAFSGAIAVAIGVRSPATGLLGLVVLCVIDPVLRVVTFVPLGLPHNALNHLLLLVALLTATRMAQRLDLRIALLAGLTAVLALGIPHSISTRLGLQATYEIFIAFAIIGAFMRTTLDDEMFKWLAIVAATASIATVGLYYLTRPRDIFINPNALVHVSLAALACITLLAATRARANWWLVTVMAAVNMGLAFITASRGGFLVSVPLMLFVLARTPGVRARSHVVGAVVVMFILVPMIWSGQASRTSAKWHRLIDPDLTIEQATSRRVSIAEYGFQTFLDNPLGVGTGGFHDARPGIVVREGVGLAAHSGWVRTLAENGLPGMVFLLGFLASLLLSRPRHPDIARSLGPVVAITMSVMLVTTEFQSKALWLLVGGAMVLLTRTDTAAEPVDGSFRPSVTGREIRRRRW